MLRNNNGNMARPKQAMKGKGGGLDYFVSRAVTNIRQNVSISILTIGTITIALLLLSLFLLVYVNLEGMADEVSSRVHVTAYFEQELPPDQQASIMEAIKGIEGTGRVRYISKEEAFQRFRDRLKGQETLLEGVSADILPASLEIVLDRNNRDSESIQVYVGRLRKIPAITEIQYGEEWLKRFHTFMTFVRLVGAVLGGFLLLAVVFIVSNTIKLTIYARKDELELMGLVGATRFFIKAPFIIEGIIQGAAGALLSVGILAGIYFAFLYNAGNFLSFNPEKAGISFLSFWQLGGILFVGIMLGFLGSINSLKRFING